MLLDSLFANFPELACSYDRSEVVLLDCRALNDGNQDWRLRGHAGYHPKNLAGLLDSSAWNELWHDAYTRVKSVLESGDASKVLVVCYCRVGRHRSVGVRHLMHHCFSAMDFQNVISQDLCSGRLWSRLCDGQHARCVECHPCGLDFELAESVRENALRQWLAYDWSFLRGMVAGAGVGCSLGHDGQEIVTSECVVEGNGYSSDGAGLNFVGDSDACVVGGYS